MNPRARTHRGRVRALLAAGVLGALAVVPVGSSAAATVGTTASHTWGVDGRVSVLLDVGDTVLVGGEFTSVLDPDGVPHPIAHLAKYDVRTGEFDLGWNPGVAGDVTSLAQADGVLYVGGGFGQVAGQVRRSTAALDLASATLLPWRVDTDLQVDDVAVRDGWVYLAGPFTTLTDGSGTTEQPYLARAAVAGGLVDRSWHYDLSGRARTVLAPAGRSVLYVGGDFTSIDGVGAAGKLGLVSTSTHAIDPVFRAGTTNLQYRAPAFDLDLDGGDLLVGVAGSGGGCSLLDATTGATRWSKHTTGDVVGVAFHDGSAYCAGHFSGIGSFDGLDRYKLAVVDPVSGAVSSFAPVVNSALGAWSLAATPVGIVVGGDFTKIDAVTQTSLATFRDVEDVTGASAVRALTGTPGSASALVTWSTPSTDGGSTLVGYRVLRREGATSPTVLGTTGQRSWADTSARNGHTYEYSVVPMTGAGDGTPSDEVTVTPQAGLLSTPSAPRSVKVTAAVGAVDLGWTPPSSTGGAPITVIRVFRGTSTGAESPYVDLPPGATTYQDVDVTAGTRYFYQLAAVNEVGTGPLTVEKSAVPTLGVPAKPVLSGSSVNGKVSLSWTVSSPGGAPITKYMLIRDGIRLATVKSPATAYLDSTVVRGGTYRYQVRAYNGIGWSKYSDAVTVTVT